MDNLTHTLAGLAVGELAYRISRRNEATEPDPRFRRALWIVSAIANNVPDLDFLYSAITPGPLSYLLHHRGHTHTAALAIPQAALVLLFVWLYARRRGIAANGHDRAWLVGIAVLGPLLHVAMDALNSYGVHPFWPVDSGWYYGDSLFIVEPLLWIALAAPLAVSAATLGARMFLGLAVATAVGLCWAMAMVPVYAAAGATFLASLTLSLSFRFRPMGRSILAPALALGLVALFAIAGGKVRRALRADGIPGYDVEDIVLTPAPANPFCWTALVVASDGKSAYVVRRGLAAAWPSVVAVSRCSSARFDGGSVPLRKVPEGSAPLRAVRWLGDYHGDLALLRREAHARCDLAAFLRFSRVPYLERRSEAPPQPAGMVAGDLRFDFRGRRSFASLSLAGDPVCPPHVPPWTPPARWAIRATP